ncbi:hypothetical protein [Kitasatospora aureofaciens]
MLPVPVPLLAPQPVPVLAPQPVPVLAPLLVKWVVWQNLRA